MVHYSPLSYACFCRMSCGVSAVGARPCRKLRRATTFVLIFFVAEIIGGIWSGSLAIISDAAHLLADVSVSVPSNPHVPSHHTLLYSVPSNPIPPHPVLSYPVPSHLILSHPIPCHPIPSHPIPSHPIPLHHVSSHTIPFQELSWCVCMHACLCHLVWVVWSGRGRASHD